MRRRGGVVESLWELVVAVLLTAISVFNAASGFSGEKNSLVALRIDRP